MLADLLSLYGHCMVLKVLGPDGETTSLPFSLKLVSQVPKPIQMYGCERTRDQMASPIGNTPFVMLMTYLSSVMSLCKS